MGWIEVVRFLFFPLNETSSGVKFELTDRRRFQY